MFYINIIILLRSITACEYSLFYASFIKNLLCYTLAI